MRHRIHEAVRRPQRPIVRAVFLAALFSPAAASGATFVVAPDASGAFATIQAAIDAAASGDVIELLDGTFHGPGNRDLDPGGKAIVVRSQSGTAAACLIACGGSSMEPHRQ